MFSPDGTGKEICLIAVVVENGAEPLLSLFQANALALGVALDLVLADLAHSEVLRLRVRENKGGNRRGRHHGERVAQLDTSKLLVVVRW